MKVEIISARDAREIDAGGKTKVFAVYQFTIDDLGPFTHRIPTEEDTVEKLQEAIAKKKAIIQSGD